MGPLVAPSGKWSEIKKEKRERRGMSEGREVLKYSSLWYLVVVQLGNEEERSFYLNGEGDLLSLSRCCISSLLGDVQTKVSARQVR